VHCLLRSPKRRRFQSA